MYSSPSASGVRDFVAHNVVDSGGPDAHFIFGDDLHPVPECRGQVGRPVVLRGVRLDAAPERAFVGEHVAHLHGDARAPDASLQNRLNGEQFRIRDASIRHRLPEQQAQHIGQRLVRAYCDERFHRQRLHEQLVRHFLTLAHLNAVRQQDHLLRRDARHLE